jgi:head-tail adaptor
MEFYGGDTGKEPYEADKQVNVKEIVFRIRLKSRINPSDYRVVFNGQTFNINEVREDIDKFRKQYQKLVCDAR